MGQTYSCRCKLSDPESLDKEVSDATDKILSYRSESLSPQEAESLATFIARHDRYFNEPNWTFQEGELLDRLQELDIPSGYSRAVKDYFEKHPSSLSRLTRCMNMCSRPRFVTTPIPVSTWAPVVSTVTTAPIISPQVVAVTPSLTPAVTTIIPTAPSYTTVMCPCCTSTIVPSHPQVATTTTYTPPSMVTTTTPSTVYTTTSYFQPARATTSYTAVAPTTFVSYLT